MSDRELVASRNLPANGENEPHSRRAQMREAAAVCAELGLPISGGRLRTLITSYLATGGEVALRSWVIGYADPTGERAAHNVDRERGDRS